MNLHITLLSRNVSALNWRHLASLLLIFMGLGMCATAVAQNTSPEMSREYFIRQGADEALLISISGYEAELNASVYASERRLLLSSSTHGSRIAPLFQFIESSGKDRQLDIQVSSGHFTRNTQFEIAVTRLKVWDNRSQTLARAYALLSFGMQTAEIDTAANWSVKINSLLGAADTFGQYGMTELELWSTWLATWLIQTRLHDYNMVLGLLGEIQSTTRASQWREINLAAQKTRSAAIAGLLDSGRGEQSNIGPAEVHTALTQTADLASSMGYRFEQSQALYDNGLQFIRSSDDSLALEQFQQALNIADDIGDAGLSKSIRESMAGIHAEQGDDPATSEVLRQLESQLNRDGEGGDEMALNLLQQGRIFMRIWQFTDAQEVLLQALSFENNSSIASQINLELARVSYETGQLQETPKYLTAAGVSRGDINGYFDKATGGDFDASGFRKMAEAAYQNARNLARTGNKADAKRVLESLLDDVLFLRQALPGVLGSWYWQRRDDLIDDYLDLDLADETAVLLALSKGRFASRPSLLNGNREELRNLLAQSEGRGATTNYPEMTQLRQQYAKQFAWLSEQGIRNYLGALTADSVMLTYHLSTRNAYAWIADRNGIQSRKLSDPSQLHKQLAQILERIPSASSAEFETIMQESGDLLVSPVRDLLAPTIYLVPAGLTLTLPFDAFRQAGRYLLETHAVVKVMSFPSTAPSERLDFAPPNQVFLAGDPQNFESGYANQLRQSRQILTVTNLFVGPGLNIIQGTALLPDEFQSEPYQNAELIHLAMPGEIALDYPDKSTLQLSEPLRDLGRLSLRPASIRSSTNNAGLVYLADTHTEGLPASATSQQIGLVSDFLQSGATSVIGQVSPLQESAEQAFLQRFYTELLSNGDISSAFNSTRRAAMSKADAADNRAWAALQLFTQ